MQNDYDERISRLLLKMITGSLGPDEQKQLDEWCGRSDANRKLCRRLQDTAYVDRELRRRRAVNTGRPLEEMRRRIRLETAPRRRKLMVWLTAAAAVAIWAVCIGPLFYRHFSHQGNAAGTLAQTADTTAIIRPGETKAVLTLPDGSKVQLGKETAANRRAVTSALDAGDGSEGNQAKSLCLDVPRGGEFKIVLEDGTEVWLNSDSRLVYPEHFAQSERRVSVQGEAYFKVEHDAERPFYVETDGQLVRVYGTQFNIRSYSEDHDVFTTLVEGSVALCRKNGVGGELVLTPGHQSCFSKGNEDLNVRSVDTDIITSWRHGKFVFENQSLEHIMCDLSRWYAFDYSFADAALKNIVFMGSIPRYADFGTALAIIEKSGGLRFEVRGKHVLIRNGNH